ncbi:NADPH-dependent FMN reductase [Alkalihalobacillus sp. AL-G]|uniref:NADPH-dependent FMN reductase n=1 Tax=Alkalihalobacillus sp. AL-G TaxID=2926399 RepID=UPI00272AC14C|nr:NADPH-dependent FMN reductase [Alkalihalobacillus sp. AL-G]WLD92653.1 NAD(P)H-dependent oxidoreductase [Alkalihalobacillus sp. AL-G]
MSNVLIISGSARKEGRTPYLAIEGSNILMMKHQTVKYFSLHDEELPVFNGDEEQDYLESVRKLRDMARKANGFIIFTPEYHNGMSGALKNALDYLSKEEFENKPVAICSVSGGGKGGINALNNLRLVLRGLQAHVLPQQVIADPSDFNVDNTLINKEIKDRLSLLIKELIIMLRVKSELYKGITIF